MEPEIIVSAGQIDAVNRLLREINAAGLVARDERPWPASPEPVVVSPVTVELISVPAVEIAGAPGIPRSIQ